MNYAQFGTHLTKLYGLADHQIARELNAQQRLKKAIEETQRAIEQVNSTSAVVHIDGEAFDNLVHDEFPDFQGWNEKLAQAQH